MVTVGDISLLSLLHGVISEEGFMENTKDWLNNLKIRGSWGLLGNQDALTDYYPWMNTYNLDASYPLGGALQSGYYQKHISCLLSLGKNLVHGDLVLMRQSITRSM